MSLKIKSSVGTYTVEFYQTIESTLPTDSSTSCLYLVDENVYTLYKNHFTGRKTYIIPASELNKSLQYASKILDYLTDNSYKSDTHLVVVGGGILQDIGGFVASIFCRGIKYTLVPTTLLAQCDSCIGGKTSINHNNTKNILGTFYPPAEIRICTKFLNTLSQADIKSGYGEILKFYTLNNLLFCCNYDNIEELIQFGLKYKAGIIERDEFDKGERKLLNFGHSFGHALESSSEYKIPHGSAVVIGMLIANQVSYNLGFTSKEYIESYQKVLKPFIKHLKIDEKWFEFSRLFSYLKSDKKNVGNYINMVLYTDGQFKLHPVKDLELLQKSIQEVYEII